MNSYTIRTIVRLTKSIIETNDLACKRSPTQLEITELAKLLNLKFKYNEKTILAVLLYLKDNGFEIENYDCGHVRRLLLKIKETEKSCCEFELSNLRVIAESLFSQQIRNS